VINGRKELLEKGRKTPKKFLDAVKKGNEDAIEEPDGGAEILCEAAPERDQEFVKARHKYLKDQYIADADRWGYIDPDRWNLFYNWLNENGLTENEIPENTGFSNEYLPE